ncbi:16S rRNA (guanine(966)-N(2))-methyltransferase RsmD [Peptoniphilus equinus]|uniref:16S rRNA (Guanine(966)-N(2))-methyltransferase RsmD n=1 Tax=Peptoniphilus equinus TaxID=3016343 RepID=A0ABY7QS08_9FIRM|nr:16S rRNA (guanine(966)-N(2))-methyltransferase RsmD [Peptoniphilus equinus]WBW49579.1 16S rRNA (guanine(966)-N(2))-methyltransferase RsmD [Peptoniphilus equinus]
MRVIAGQKRGLKLDSPQGVSTRPTEDRVKENVFNILGQQFFDAKVLDLFAGTGQIGIEFLSRGAAAATFVEKDPAAVKVLRHNLTKSGFDGTVVAADVVESLKRVKGTFDYIYMDPPYQDHDLYVNVAEAICQGEMLDGILIVENPSDHVHDLGDYFTLVKEKKYGSTTVSFWSNQ